MKIRVLPDSVANQIAAGEVVGSPSSVVKELTENAVDAGATTVTVNFRADGRELVQVIDDGVGMTPADARLAFDKHATSKITSLEDIYELQTFGFRGEALPSIAAVAEVELITRTEEQELATQIIIEGGEYRSQEMVVAPKGSNFKVSNLFFNVPARRKFLESSEREAGKIKTEFRRVALCHPEVAFALYRDDAPLFNLPKSSLRARIAGLMGKSVAAQLLEVSTTTTIVKVEGYIGRPECAKKRKEEQFFFVNGRFFKSPYLHRAVMAAYEKLIPAGLTPSYFLYLEVDTQKVDVNVHPQKTEVKFSEDSEIWQIVNAAVRESLAKTGVIPMMDFEEQDIDIPVYSGNARGNMEEPRTHNNPFYNPFAKESEGETKEFGSELGGGFGGSFGGSFGRGGFGGSFGTEVYGEERDSSIEGKSNRGLLCDKVKSYPSSPEEPRMNEYGSLIEGDDEELRIFSEGELTAYRGEFVPEDFGAVGGVLSLGGGYAAALYRGALAIVDLEKARELVLYNYYMNLINADEAAVGERMLFPQRKVFSLDDLECLRKEKEFFTSFGFDYEVVGDNYIELAAYPAELHNEAEAENVLYEMIDSLREGVGSPARERKERLARVLSRTRGVVSMGAVGQEALVAMLSDLSHAMGSCSAVVRIVEKSELDTLFGK